MAKNNAKESHLLKDLGEISKQSKNLVKNAQEMSTNFIKLPWKKLPAIGWFYIILLAIIIIVIGVFIAPNAMNF